ncbi:MAG: CoA transferase [Burkholderiales bacterium]|nr:CoA transferase [Burkholderiales bacterium]
MQLIDSADVLIENFRPDTLEPLGWGWTTLAALSRAPVDRWAPCNKPVQRRLSPR